jgi:hypothetical protein
VFSVEKAFRKLTSKAPASGGAPPPLPGSSRCHCGGKCLHSSLSHIQHQLHAFLASRPSEVTAGAAGAVTPEAAGGQFDYILDLLQDARKIFVAHRASLIGLSSSASNPSSRGASPAAAAKQSSGRARGAGARSSSRTSKRRRSAARSDDQYCESDHQEDEAEASEYTEAEEEEVGGEEE